MKRRACGDAPRRPWSTFRSVLKAVLFALAGVPAHASSVELRLNNPLPESRPETVALERFAEEVRARSGGELTIRVVSGGALGIRDADVLRVLPTGAVDLSLVWANYLGRDAPVLAATLIQGAVGSVEEFERALPVVRQSYAEELADWDVIPVGFLAIPMLEASVFCRDQPVRTLADLADRKVRVWAKDQVSSFGRLGIATQIVPQGDLYFAMKTGVVDCALYPALYAHTVSMPEVARFAAYLYPMAGAPYILGVGRARWASLSEAQRGWISAAADAMWLRSADYSQDHARELAARAALAEQGITWLDDFPATDRERFLRSVSATWAELAERAGGRGPEYRARILAALGRDATTAGAVR
jgi:TRAP-type transport system periplasmic protein